jgi:hypothetical protein
MGANTVGQERALIFLQRILHPMVVYQLPTLFLAVLLTIGGAVPIPEDSVADTILVDRFESDAVGEPPGQWEYVSSEKEVLPPHEVLGESEQFFVAREDGNQFVRAITKGEALRFTVRNGQNIEWNLQSHSRLQWRWRAHTLPEGASEKGKNDTGAAVYVTFGKDWLGRPKSIKYTYSSSLPVGTVVSFGPLKVIVVDSAQEPGFGEWKTMQRNVLQDYRQVFGGSPPDRPVSITLWSDSDTTGDESKVDFDDIKLISSRR